MLVGIIKFKDATFEHTFRYKAEESLQEAALNAECAFCFGRPTKMTLVQIKDQHWVLRHSLKHVYQIFKRVSKPSLEF